MVKQKHSCSAAQWVSAIICFVLNISISSSVLATESGSSKQILNDIIAVEHLEIITPLSGALYATAYFSIWNGISRNIDLKEISNSSGQSLILEKSIQNNDAIKWVNNVLPKTIPAKSEFITNPKQFRLLLDYDYFSKNESSDLYLLFQFSEGRQLMVKATVLPFGTKPSDHHHGMSDTD